MQYVVEGILKSGSEERLIALHNEFNEHLSQQTDKVSLFGLLRDKEGRRSGYLAVINADSFGEAEAFLEQSPFFQKVRGDLPFACKGGVCGTCRARLVEGTVQMDANYALEPEEVERGYVLTCQSHPTAAEVVLDYDG